jgi:hypothetical protein
VQWHMSWKCTPSHTLLHCECIQQCLPGDKKLFFSRSVWYDLKVMHYTHFMALQPVFHIHWNFLWIIFLKYPSVKHKRYMLPKNLAVSLFSQFIINRWTPVKRQPQTIALSLLCFPVRGWISVNSVSDPLSSWLLCKSVGQTTVDWISINSVSDPLTCIRAS